MTNEEDPQPDEQRSSTSPKGDTKDATSPPANQEPDQGEVERGKENIEKISGN